MFSKPGGEPDFLDDQIGSACRKLADRTGWSAVPQDQRTKLNALLTRRGYVRFYANVTNYGTWHVGESMLFYVPNNRRGALSAFRGQCIRIACIGSGRYTRVLMAGPINATKTLKARLMALETAADDLQRSEWRSKATPLQMFAASVSLKLERRTDGLVFLAAMEGSSMASTWTDLLALEKLDDGQWRLHHGALQMAGSLCDIPEGRRRYDDDGNIVPPRTFRGEKVAGIADGEFILIDKFFSDASSPPFKKDQWHIAEKFLLEHGWIKKGERNHLELDFNYAVNTKF